MVDIAAPHRPGGAGPWFTGRPRLTVAVAVGLYAAVLGLWFVVDAPADAVSLLFCLPIALLAVAFGLRAGLLGGVAGIGLVGLWVAMNDVGLSALGWATRLVPMVLLGGLLGHAVDRLHRSERQRRQLEAAAQRHRDAVEINDTIVQGLAAAKWALESDELARGLEVVTETLQLSQGIISDLLRDAGMGVGGKRGRSPVTTD
jgi:hypothetical protein